MEHEPASSVSSLAQSSPEPVLKDASLPRRPESSTMPVAQPQTESRTIIYASIKVKGEIVGDEDVTFDGRVDGIINLSRTLTIGKRGSVEADVRASNVVVHGSLIGNVIAEGKVEILATGRLEGNIKSPKIVIAEGAHFKGNVDMSAGSQGASLGSSAAAEAGATSKGGAAAKSA